VDHDPAFDNFVMEVDNRISVWLSELEISNYPIAIPEELYDELK